MEFKDDDFEIKDKYHSLLSEVIGNSKLKTYYDYSKTFFLSLIKQKKYLIAKRVLVRTLDTLNTDRFP